MNKKAAIEVLDLLFLGVAAFFLLAFVSSTLVGSVNQNDNTALRNTADFKRLDSAIHNLRVQVQAGEEVKVEDIDSLVKESKVLDGKTIVNCRDYLTEEDCKADLVKLNEQKPGYECRWNSFSEKCEFMQMQAAVQRSR